MWDFEFAKRRERSILSCLRIIRDDGLIPGSDDGSLAVGTLPHFLPMESGDSRKKHLKTGEIQVRNGTRILGFLPIMRTGGPKHSPFLPHEGAKISIFSPTAQKRQSIGGRIISCHGEKMLGKKKSVFVVL